MFQEKYKRITRKELLQLLKEKNSSNPLPLQGIGKSLSYSYIGWYDTKEKHFIYSDCVDRSMLLPFADAQILLFSYYIDFYFFASCMEKLFSKEPKKLIPEEDGRYINLYISKFEDRSYKLTMSEEFLKKLERSSMGVRRVSDFLLYKTNNYMYIEEFLPIEASLDENNIKKYKCFELRGERLLGLKSLTAIPVKACKELDSYSLDEICEKVKSISLSTRKIEKFLR